MKAEINLDKSGFSLNNSIKVDGVEMVNCVKDIAVYGGAGNIPELRLSLFVHSCKMTIDGVLEVNSIETPPGVDLQLYKLLKEKFEGKEYTDIIK